MNPLITIASVLRGTPGQGLNCEIQVTVFVDGKIVSGYLEPFNDAMTSIIASVDKALRDTLTTVIYENGTKTTETTDKFIGQESLAELWREVLKKKEQSNADPSDKEMPLGLGKYLALKKFTISHNLGATLSGDYIIIDASKISAVTFDSLRK